MNTSDAVFYFLLSCFVVHEMDAVRCKEWRLLIGFRSLPEKTAETLFIWSHIPLAFFILIFHEFSGGSAKFWTEILLSVFAVIHVALHWRLKERPLYEFKSRSSRALINLVGLAGLIGILSALYL